MNLAMNLVEFEKLSLEVQAKQLIEELRLPLYVVAVARDDSDVLEEICVGSNIHVVKTVGDSKELPFTYVVTRRIDHSGSRHEPPSEDYHELACAPRVLDALPKALIEATSDYVHAIVDGMALDSE